MSPHTSKAKEPTSEGHQGLVAEILHMTLAEGNSRMMVIVALGTLKGISHEDIADIADFAVDQVRIEKMHQDDRKRVLIQRFSDKKYLEQRRRAILEGTYQPDTTTIPIYRSASMLYEGMNRTRTKPPHPATKRQIFAALGLQLLHFALQANRGGQNGLWQLDGRERALLDAAECIYACQMVSDEARQTREKFHHALLNIMPSHLKQPNGKWMPAKEARRLFLKLFPDFADKVENERSFATTYTRLQKKVIG